MKGKVLTKLSWRNKQKLGIRENMGERRKEKGKSHERT